MSKQSDFWFGGTPSLRELRRQRAAIAAFRGAYEPYLARTVPLLDSGQAVSSGEERERVQRLAVAAEDACSSAGHVLVLSPAPATPAPALVGLSRVALAHEDGQWRNPPIQTIFHLMPRPTYDLVRDALVQSDAELEIREDDVRRRRRNPLHWLERVLHVALAIPGYLLSLVFGIDPGQWQTTGQRVAHLLSGAGSVASILALWIRVH